MFSVFDELVVGVIVGGEKVIQYVVEGVEDDVDVGCVDFVVLFLNYNDIVIGILVSGCIFYVSGVLEYVCLFGCFIGVIVCSFNVVIFIYVDVVICLVVGFEVFIGSMCMKLGMV